MFDLPTRLLVAYGLIGVMMIALAAFVWWRAHNSPKRRHLRERIRLEERYRVRDEAAAAAARER